MFLQDILTQCLLLKELLYLLSSTTRETVSTNESAQTQQGTTAEAKSKIDTNISAKDPHYSHLTFFNFKVTKQD